MLLKIEEEVRKTFGDVKGKIFVLTNLIREKNQTNGYLSIFQVENEELFIGNLAEQLNSILGLSFTATSAGMRVDFESEKEYLYLADWTQGFFVCK